MRTFQVLSVEARRAYLDAQVMSILRKDFNADWKKTHMSALEALEAFIEIIKSNEIMSIEMVLGIENNKQWWPFAFVTAGGNKSDRVRNEIDASESIRATLTNPLNTIYISENVPRGNDANCCSSYVRQLRPIAGDPGAGAFSEAASCCERPQTLSVPDQQAASRQVASAVARRVKLWDDDFVG